MTANTKKLEFAITIECGDGGSTDIDRVEEMLALHVQDLTYDEEFTSALQPVEFISTTVKPLILDK